QQELGEGRCSGAQIGNGARQLRQHHARAVRMHSGEERGAPSGTAGLGIVVHEHATFLRNPVDVRRFPDHQAAMIAARLHPADIIAHDEQDVWFLVLRLGRSDRAGSASRAKKKQKAVIYYVSFHISVSCCYLVLDVWMTVELSK